jgi:hypothetical protein
VRCFFLGDLKVESFLFSYLSGSGGVGTDSNQTTMNEFEQRAYEKGAGLAIEFPSFGESFIAVSPSGKGGVPSASPSAISGLGGATSDVTST